MGGQDRSGSNRRLANGRRPCGPMRLEDKKRSEISRGSSSTRIYLTMSLINSTLSNPPFKASDYSRRCLSSPDSPGLRGPILLTKRYLSRRIMTTD